MLVAQLTTGEGVCQCFSSSSSSSRHFLLQGRVYRRAEMRSTVMACERWFCFRWLCCYYLNKSLFWKGKCPSLTVLCRKCWQCCLIFHICQNASFLGLCCNSERQTDLPLQKAWKPVPKSWKASQLKLISTKNPEDLLSDVCCDVNSKQCMYRECQFCVNKDVLFASGVSDSTENNTVSRRDIRLGWPLFPGCWLQQLAATACPLIPLPLLFWLDQPVWIYSV